MFYAQDVTYAGFALGIISLPLMLDILIHLTHKKLFQNSNGVLIGRCFYVLVAFLFGSQIFLQYKIFLLPSFEASVSFMLSSYRIMFFATVMYFVSYTDRTKKSLRSSLIISFTDVLVCILATPNLFNWMSTGLKNKCVSLFLLGVAGFTIHHMYRISKNPKDYDYSHRLYVNTLFIFFVLAFSIRGVVSFIRYLYGDGIFNFYEGAFVLAIYTYVVLTAYITVVPALIAYEEAIEFKDDVIATKESYERYIAHEMRSPFNGVHMGIQYCLELIPSTTTDPQKVNIRDTLVEIKSSCEDGLIILDDLLLNDKYKNGKVVLHKEEVNVFTSIGDYLNMFNVQLRAKGITYELFNYSNVNDLLDFHEYSSVTNFESTKGMINTVTSNHLTENSEYVKSSDTVLVDKAKWGQVLRNVMSNSIKFTPKKGSIKVYITFVPDIVTEKRSKACNSNSKAVNNSWYDRYKSIIYYDKLSSKSLTESSMMPFSTENDHREQEKEKRRKSISKPKHDHLSDKDALNGSKLDMMSNSSDDSMISESHDDILGKLVIDIKDSGAGISLENQAKLFKEIVQFNPNKLQAGGGSGLGMMISKNIIDMHGGSISVHSEGEGKGTTFRIEIPMTRKIVPNNVNTDTKNVDEQDHEYSVPSSVQPSSLISKKKVLIADDIGTNRKFLRKLLELRGHVCEEAEDGLEALNMVKESHLKRKRNSKPRDYDVIFMDFMMPEMNGPDATRAIRELGFEGPILGVTGNALEDDKNLFLSAGATNVIVKPLKMPVLLKLIDL